MTLTPEPSNTTVQTFTLDQKGNPIPYTTGPYGNSVIFVRADVAGQSGHGKMNGSPVTFGGNPYPLNSQGNAMSPLPGYFYQAYTSGTYSFTANYSGDTSFNAGTSLPATFTVTKAQTNVSTMIIPCDR